MTTLNQTDQTEKLKDELILAQRAQTAYDQFVRGFIAEKRTALFEAFCANTEDKVDINIRSMMVVLDHLEQEIKTIIDTGKLAAISLESKHEN